MSALRRVGLLTGGGDAPGLNAVLYAVARTLGRAGVESVGILDGFEGFLERRYRALAERALAEFARSGGTILGTTNRCNPFAVRGPAGPADRSAEILANASAAKLDAVIVIGGDGTLRIARRLSEMGMRLVGVPKTIDNDIAATDYSFGFWTAIGVATEALDRLRDTAESHHRVMILEVMGRDAGWIALHAGIAGGADVILIPEIPFRVEDVEAEIEARVAAGQNFSLIVVAEGAMPEGETPSHSVADAGDGHPRLGGAAHALALALAPLNPHEIRVTVLGYLQRGGSPVPYDRILATELGHHAAELVLAGRFGRMVRVSRGEIGDVPLEEATRAARKVDPESALVATARAIGIGFGADGPTSSARAGR